MAGTEEKTGDSGQESPKPFGRPSKILSLSEAVREQVLKLVEGGNDAAVAAGACGIDRRTFQRWVARGEDGEEPFATFAADIACAKDRWETRAVAEIQSGDGQGVGFGPAKAALEVLGRRIPKRWAQRVNVHVQEGLEHFVATAKRVLEREQYVKLIIALAQDNDGRDESTTDGERVVS